MHQRIRGALSLAILLATVVGLPWVLAATVGNPLHSWSGIRAGDMSDQDVIAIGAAVAYLAWASFVLALSAEIVETAAATINSRPRRALRIPLLGAQQDLARTLLTTALLLLPAALAVSGPAVRAAAAAPVATTAMSVRPALQPATIPAPTHPVTAPVRAATFRYVIPACGGLRSYWALAERYLGDGQRWPQIWHLNQGRSQADGSVMDTPRRLYGGWTVLIPTAPTPVAASTDDLAAHDVTVHPGDTLSGLAAADGIADWREVWATNAGRNEPGGEHFTDPDLIKPGWTLTLPHQSATHPTAPAPAATTSPAPAPATAASPPPRETTQPPAAVRPATSAAHGSGAELTPVAEWAATIAAGSGVLAAGMFLAVRRYRRRQLRHRIPGRTIAGPAPEHAPLDKTLITSGAFAVRDVAFIDRALRQLTATLAANGDPLPAVLAARLTEKHFDLVLAEPQSTPPPPPWIAVSATSWVVDKTASLSPPDGTSPTPVAPYPTLVSVGCTPAGEEWLIDLEQAGALTFAGDPARCMDLTRFLVAELAHNVWSDHLTVTLAGFGADLVDLNPARLTHSENIAAAAGVAANAAAAQREVADREAVDVLTGRLHGISGDTWMPQVLFVAPSWSRNTNDTAAVAALLDAVGESTARTAVAAVLPDDRPGGAPVGLRLTVHADGTLLIPQLDVIAAAQQLPADQAAEMAQYLAAVRNGIADAPMPPADSDHGAAQYADLAGALLPELTEPRPADSAAPALGPQADPPASSLLPLSTPTYVATTATTPADVEILAPAVPPQVRTAVEAADQDLDTDLAAWHDRASGRAKLRLLGHVQLTAPGPAPEGKKAIVTEAITYLALHPRGVSGDRFAADFWPANNYTIKDSNPKNTLSLARSWLGLNPATARPHLPYAKSAGQASGAAIYRLDGVLVDADLFRRLRARGEARGEAGHPDLVSALALVAGTPLTSLRGGSWLNDDGVADSDTLTVAVVEVAHLLATQALATGDTTAARHAVHTAIDTGTADDRPLLDLAATYDAEGRIAELSDTVRRLRAHHDAAVEEDLPARTYEVLLRHNWIGLSEAG